MFGFQKRDYFEGVHQFLDLAIVCCILKMPLNVEMAALVALLKMKKWLHWLSI